MPELTSALHVMSIPDESLAFNEMGDHQQRLEDLGAGRFATMDDQGIDVSILALTPPGTQPLPPEDAVRLSRAANDLAAATGGAIHLDSLVVHAAHVVTIGRRRRAQRAEEIGHVGTMVYGRSGDLFLDDPVYDDFFAAASHLRHPVFIHPHCHRPPFVTRHIADSIRRPTSPWPPSVGWHLDAGLAALRLILRGTFDRHPDLQIVLGHWGEMLLFWLDRANSLSALPDCNDQYQTTYSRTSSSPPPACSILRSCSTPFR